MSEGKQARLNAILFELDVIQKEIMKEYKVSKEVALQIATQIQQNRILQDAYCTHDVVENPSALEAIAIQLGFGKTVSYTVTDAISNVQEAIEKLEQ